MAEFTLRAGWDHVKRLAGEDSPEKALTELVWNSLDAEATTVRIDIDRNELNGILGVSVRDNGHGFNRNDATGDFRDIGDSWKRKQTRTRNDLRALHGSRGQGRIRGFALGSQVSWQSIALAVDGSLEETTVSAEANRPDRIVIDSRKIETEQPTGTVFAAYNNTQKGLCALESGKAEAELLETFAPILIAEPELEIVFDGKRIDPVENIADDEEWDLKFGPNGCCGNLRVIRWRNGNQKRILYGSSKEQFVAEIEDRQNYSSLSFTAYASAPVVRSENVKDLVLDVTSSDQSDFAQFRVAVESQLKKYLRQKTSEERAKRVADWKKQGVYPYKGEPVDRKEKAERAVFDTIAGAVEDQIPKGKERARLTLELLKSSLQANPDGLNEILYEVVSLTERDKHALQILLQETTLPNIIQSANTVSRRQKILAGLQALNPDGDISPSVQERRHLHMILEKELWVFGEGYSTMTSEKSLNSLLAKNLELSDLKMGAMPPVKTMDGKEGRTDLHFAVKCQEHDRTRHLIVELKRPSTVASDAELAQVRKYGRVIASNPAFRTVQSEWDIVLVVSKISPQVARDILNKNTGLFQEYNEPGEPLVRMFVRTWASVIEENRRRIDFMNRSLMFNPDLDDGIGYLREKYPDYVPAEIPDA